MAQKKPLTPEELLEMDGKPAYWAEDESYGLISVDDGGRWEKTAQNMSEKQRNLIFRRETDMIKLTIK